MANDQRKVIYEQRTDLLDAADINEMISTIRFDVVDNMINSHIPPGSVDEQWNVAGLEQQLSNDLALTLPIQQWLDEDDTLYEEKSA